MAKLKIVIAGAPVLREVAQPVERPPRKRKVAGSCPARGSKRFMA